MAIPGLTSSRTLGGCDYRIQQERPAEGDRLLSDWLSSLQV
ncbi:hypothetical protein RKD23_000142 [Streptomyces sp. SAI-170]